MTAPRRVPRMPVMLSPTAIARRVLTGLALLAWAATAMPQTASLYTVEIIVFRNPGTNGALPPNVIPPMVGDDGIEATPVATAKLNAAARKLASAGEFKVLAHTAWTQGPTAWNSGRGVSARQLGLGNGVDGKISLERNEVYPLNLRLDLIVEEGGNRFRIQEVRRNVKVDQIQYFDHPSVGVLAIVTRASD
jgi:hypothetical protein